MIAEPFTLQDLIEVVRRRAGPGNELDRVQEAGGLAGDVGMLTEQLLDYFVQDARRAGLSWSQIGERLGVTKQGAQQRFTDHDRGPADLSDQLIGLGLPPLEEPKVRGSGGLLRKVTGGPTVRRFTQAGRQTIAAAHEEARRLGSDFVGTEHLLLGLLQEQGGLAARALHAVGVDLDAVAAKVVPVSRSGANLESAPLLLASGSTEALQTAMREALRLGHHYIGTEHILLGLLAGQNAATDLLADLGNNPKQLGDQILGLLERG
ncbi:MAG: Clp protease N-terminal domain-containing protein [Actinomycetota bacterium]